MYNSQAMRSRLQFYHRSNSCQQIKYSSFITPQRHNIPPTLLTLYSQEVSGTSNDEMHTSSSESERDRVMLRVSQELASIV